MLKGKKLAFANTSAFLLLFYLHILDNIVKEGQVFLPYTGILKNAFLVFISAFYLLQLVQNSARIKTYIFKKELIIIFYWASGLLILSIIMAIRTQQYTFESFISIFRIILSVVVAFLVLNVLDFYQIYWIMVVILIVGILGFIFAMGVESFAPAELEKISFFYSFSPLESHFFSPLSLSLCLFFLYYRKSGIFTLISLLFVFLTFKRFMILFAAVVAIGSIFIKLDKPIKPKWKLYFKIGMSLMVFIYLMIITGKVHVFSTEFINQLTMGRSEMFEALINSKFKSFGLESSKVFLQRDIEMDLLKFYIELSIISVFLTINQLCNLCGKKMYSFLLIILLFVEMLTSHFYDIIYFWILFYVTLGCVNYDYGENITHCVRKKYLKFKHNPRKSKN